jgi:Tol biopolymer transport system component
VLLSYWIDLASPNAPKALPAQVRQALDFSGTHLLRDDNAIEYRLVAYGLASGRETTLQDQVFVSSASFSPSGEEVAFYTPSNSEGEEGLWLVPAAGGKRTKLVSGMEIDGDLAWSHDGQVIAFTRWDLRDEYEVWSVERDGTNLKRLAQNASAPQWTRIP